MICVNHQLIPVYLKSRNIGENSIIIATNGDYESSDSATRTLDSLINIFPEDTINKISFNINDCIIYEALT